MKGFLLKVHECKPNVQFALKKLQVWTKKKAANQLAALDFNWIPIIFLC
jgi:hypothetical protein